MTARLLTLPIEKFLTMGITWLILIPAALIFTILELYWVKWWLPEPPAHAANPLSAPGSISIPINHVRSRAVNFQNPTRSIRRQNIKKFARSPRATRRAPAQSELLCRRAPYFSSARLSLPPTSGGKWKTRPANPDSQTSSLES
jgi:hypothetical protein